MNRQHEYKVSLKNYNQLLRNLQSMSEDCFFLPHPVYMMGNWAYRLSAFIAQFLVPLTTRNDARLIQDIHLHYERKRSQKTYFNRWKLFHV